jgi:hypothetical protein
MSRTVVRTLGRLEKPALTAVTRETLSFTFGAPGGPLALNHSEVTDNRSDSGGGIYTSVGSPVTLKHTFVGENHPDNCFPDGSISGCFD